MNQYVVLDFETAHYPGDSACALAMVKVRNRQIEEEFYRLIKPPRPYFSFTYLHGISWRDVANEPDFAGLWPEIENFMAGASYLAAHNAPFDRRVFHACCASYGLAVPEIPFLCTLKGARRALKLASHRLDNICRHLQIELQHHQALSDARAAAQLLLHLHENGLQDWQMRLR